MDSRQEENASHKAARVSAFFLVRLKVTDDVMCVALLSLSYHDWQCAACNFTVVTIEPVDGGSSPSYSPKVRLSERNSPQHGVVAR